MANKPLKTIRFPGIDNVYTIPSKTSELTNDSGFITDAGVTSFNGSTGAVTYTAPVRTVNGQTGDVTVNDCIFSDANTDGNIVITK